MTLKTNCNIKTGLKGTINSLLQYDLPSSTSDITVFQILSSFTHIHKQQFCITKEQINQSKLQICETKVYILKGCHHKLDLKTYASLNSKCLLSVNILNKSYKSILYTKYQSELFTLRVLQTKLAVACKMALVIHAYLR